MSFCRNSSLLTMLLRTWIFSSPAIWQRTSTYFVSTVRPKDQKQNKTKKPFHVDKALSSWLKYGINIFWNASDNLGSLRLLHKLVRRFPLQGPLKQPLLGMHLRSESGLHLDCTRAEVLSLWFSPQSPLPWLPLSGNLMSLSYRQIQFSKKENDRLN